MFKNKKDVDPVQTIGLTLKIISITFALNTRSLYHDFGPTLSNDDLKF